MEPSSSKSAEGTSTEQPLDLTVQKKESLDEHELRFSEMALMSLLQQRFLVSMLSASPTEVPPKQTTRQGKKTDKRFEANARERSRVQQLGDMFDALRACLPVPEETKLSKLATLKVATAYIAYLSDILREDTRSKKRKPAAPKKLKASES